MSDSISQKQMEHRLGVTAMTIHLWRKGLAGKNKIMPMPFKSEALGGSGKRSRIKFDEQEVLSWLKENRPGLVTKFEENSCGCAECRKSRALPIRTSQSNSVATPV